MSQRYDIFLTGDLLPGTDPQTTRQRLEALFRTDRATVERLLDGGERRVRRGCSKEEALRYRKALIAAGVRPEVRLADGAAAPEATAGPEGPGPELTVLPPGADVLRPEERRSFTPAVIDTSRLSVAPEGALPPAPKLAVSRAPDTAHLELAPLGSDVIDDAYRRVETASAPPTDHLSLQE